jgi:hypothetical protein
LDLSGCASIGIGQFLWSVGDVQGEYCQWRSMVDSKSLVGRLPVRHAWVRATESGSYTCHFF